MLEHLTLRIRHRRFVVRPGSGLRSGKFLGDTATNCCLRRDARAEIAGLRGAAILSDHFTSEACRSTRRQPGDGRAQERSHASRDRLGRGNAVEVSAGRLRAACRCAWCTRERIDGTFAASFETSPSSGWRRSATTPSTSPFPTAMPAESIHGRTCKRSSERMAALRHRLRRARRERSFTADHANDQRRQDRSDRDRSAGHRRRHRRPHGRNQGQGEEPQAARVLMEKANVKRSGAISMGMDGLNNAVIPGYATPEQYVKEITSPTTASSHQKAVMAYAPGQLSDDRYLDQLGRQVREGRIRRIQRPQGAPYGHLRAAHAGGPSRQEDPVSAVAPPAGRRHQPLHGDPPVEGRRRPHRRGHRRQHPHRRVSGGARQGGDPRAAAPPAGSGCRHPAICSAPTRTPPIAATATPWPFTPAPSSQTWSASRSIR